MKIWKISLRVWITVTTLLSFLGSWAVLAHSPKPNQFDPSTISPAPVLDPIPSLDQIIFQQQSGQDNFIQSVRPVQLRTGGS